MKTIGEKIKSRREELGLTQTELAQRSGLSQKAICKVESDAVTPRKSSVTKIAAVLSFPVDYLLNPEYETPEECDEIATFTNAVRQSYGEAGVRDFQKTMVDGIAFMAGGDIPQEDKDLFYQAITAAYMQTRKDASERFSPKKYREDKQDRF